VGSAHGQGVEVGTYDPAGGASAQKESVTDRNDNIDPGLASGRELQPAASLQQAAFRFVPVAVPADQPSASVPPNKLRPCLVSLWLNVLWLYRLLTGASHAKDMNDVVTDDEQRSIGSSSGRYPPRPVRMAEYGSS
jgi:hypothetical protein